MCVVSLSLSLSLQCIAKSELLFALNKRGMRALASFCLGQLFTRVPLSPSPPPLSYTIVVEVAISPLATDLILTFAMPISSRASQNCSLLLLLVLFCQTSRKRNDGSFAFSNMVPDDKKYCSHVCTVICLANDRTISKLIPPPTSIKKSPRFNYLNFSRFRNCHSGPSFRLV